MICFPVVALTFWCSYFRFRWSIPPFQYTTTWFLINDEFFWLVWQVLWIVMILIGPIGRINGPWQTRPDEWVIWEIHVAPHSRILTSPFCFIACLYHLNLYYSSDAKHDACTRDRPNCIWGSLYIGSWVGMFARQTWCYSCVSFVNLSGSNGFCRQGRRSLVWCRSWWRIFGLRTFYYA